MLGFIFIALAFFLGIYIFIKKEKPPVEDSSTTIVTFGCTPDRTFDYSYFCKIAGVQHRNTADDEGGFMGVVRSDPENEYDKRAIAIYTFSGRLVGYIPKDEQRGLREWSKAENLLCVGFIKQGDEVPLYGKVKIFDISNENRLMLEIVKFTKWMVDQFGVRFIPPQLNIDLKGNDPKTREDWVALFNNFIDEQEKEVSKEE